MAACIGVTMGDASGVGPEIALKAFAAGDLPERCVVIGDLGVLERCNGELGLGVVLRRAGSLDDYMAGALSTWDMAQLDLDDLRVGEVCAPAGAAALEYVGFAARKALAGELRAIVTLPMNKEAARLSEPGFTGHTELIADICGTTSYAMALASRDLLVSHCSTHVSLREAAELLTTDRVCEVVELTHAAVAKLGRRPRIAVMGLNPHAGEGGAFGTEEADVIEPAVARARAGGIDAVGPLPPDTVFQAALAGRYGAVVCMYHDQGHIPMKAVAFEETVNVTLGLPIVRTSVDHGTAFDIAWQGVASTTSFVNACRLAEELL
jgi:4-hydroxythreonine-4-phosphate dehydrogenase